MPASTVRKWRDGKSIDDEIRAECDIKGGKLADIFEQVTRLYLNRAVEEGAIGDTKGKDAVMAAAIAADKMQLLRGDPTNISQTVPLTEEQKQRLEALRRTEVESDDKLVM